MRARGRVDRNQGDIVEALRDAGVAVAITSALGNGFVDLVCWCPATGVLALLEVKDPQQPPSKRRLTEAEAAFARVFPTHVVLTEDEALEAMGIGVIEDVETAGGKRK